VKVARARYHHVDSPSRRRGQCAQFDTRARCVHALASSSRSTRSAIECSHGVRVLPRTNARARRTLGTAQRTIESWTHPRGPAMTPSQRFCDFESAHEALWIEPGDPRLLEPIRHVWELGRRLAKIPPPRSMWFFCSIEEANAHRGARRSTRSRTRGSASSPIRLGVRRGACWNYRRAGARNRVASSDFCLTVLRYRARAISTIWHPLDQRCVRRPNS
jgi:hypothetical protein